MMRSVGQTGLYMARTARLRIVLGIGAAVSIVAAAVTAQATTTDPIQMKADLLDRLLPLEGASRPWFDKIVVRFSNPIGDFGEVPRPDSQLVLFTYPVAPPAHETPECELVSYTVRSRSGGGLSTLIRRKLDLNPSVSADDIALAVVIDVQRRSISMKERDKIIRDLKRLRLSPVLATRICLDNCPRYDFWHDTGTEVVRYTLRGGHGTDSEGRLVAWMDGFLSAYVHSPTTR